MKLDKIEVTTSTRNRNVTETRKEVYLPDEPKSTNSVAVCVVCLLIFVVFMSLGFIFR